MAVFHNNPILKKARGMVGGLVVFRQVRGRTIMQMRPKRPTSQSPEQKSNREQFAAASAYAREMTRDPEMKKHFASEAARMDLPNAYTAALTLKQREWKEQAKQEDKTQARNVQTALPAIKATPVTYSRAEQSLVAGFENKDVTIDLARNSSNNDSMIPSIQKAFADLQQSISKMNRLLMANSTNANNEAIVVIDEMETKLERIDFRPLSTALIDDAVVEDKATKDPRDQIVSLNNQNTSDELQV